MNTAIRFRDVVLVQFQEKVAALRTFYKVDFNVPNEFPTIQLKLETKIAEKTGYRPFESDIMKHIINAILKNCKVSDKKDFPLINEIVSNSSEIAIATRRAPGNFALFSESAAKEFEEKYSQYLLENTINGTIKAFISPHLKEGVIVGFSSGKMDGGLVLSIVDKQYQIVNIEGSERYYIYIPKKKKRR